MITDSFMQIFSSIPSEIAVVLIATLPVFELRGAIPVAMFEYGFDPFKAFYLSVIGNMVPVIPLLLFLEPVSNYLRRWHVWDVFFTWLFTRTHRKHSAKFEKYGSMGLAVFVGIPLPVTGVWTGCAAAFVFGLKFKNSLIAIFAGVLLAGTIVTVLTTTGIRIIS